MPAPNITLYTGQSPNGVKISIALEELGLSYEVRKIDMTANEQKSDWFTEVSSPWTKSLVLPCLRH
jgi:glutathione S-transferase